MENQSQNNGQRRRRNNRSGGGNRNRQNNRGNQRSSGGNRNSRNRSRRRREPKPTKWQKFLSTVTFGLLGKPKRKPSKKPVAKKSSASTPRVQQVAQKKKTKPKTEVTSGRLYVGNLDYATTETQLEELFRGVGNVLSAEVVTNSRTQQSKGFAFVEMVSIDEAKRAVDVLHDEDFMGRKLIVSGARSEGPHSSDEKSSKSDDREPVLSDSASDSEA